MAGFGPSQPPPTRQATMRDWEDPLPRHDASVSLYLSDFFVEYASIADNISARELVSAFHAVEPYMVPALAHQLVEFLKRTWREISARKGCHGVLYDMFYTLKGTRGRDKLLYFPYWFYLATQWGPNDPDLDPIREDMSALWGVEFPAEEIFYPRDIPVTLEQGFFYGINEGAPDDSPFQVSSLERLIERVPKEHLAQVIAGQLGSVAGPSDSANQLEAQLSEVRSDLCDTLYQLEDANDELAQTRRELEALQIEVERRDNMLYAVQQELQESREERQALLVWEERRDRELAEVKDKADRAFQICALLTRVLGTSGVGKPKGESEENEI
ncbi:hypothetical protein ACJ41O_010235 [Fusarium nematophilum]